jgi:hypothetical protein
VQKVTKLTILLEMLDADLNDDKGTFAGTWGAEQRRRLRGPEGLERFLTTTRKDFGSIGNSIIQEKLHKNTYAKFKASQSNRPMVLKYSGADNPHLMGLHFPPEKKELSMYITEFGGQRSTDVLPSMGRTQTRMLYSGDAPVAVGRSGPRLENGLGTSGLLGENLDLRENASTNSLVQRAWLPHEDPALMYRINGVPEAPEVLDRSLNVGQGKGDVAPGWVHGRLNAFTGNPIAKYQGTFTDDPCVMADPGPYGKHLNRPWDYMKNKPREDDC